MGQQERHSVGSVQVPRECRHLKIIICVGLTTLYPFPSPQYANKQGKLEDAAPATSYETVPITGNIDRLRKFNVPHEQQDK